MDAMPAASYRRHAGHLLESRLHSSMDDAVGTMEVYRAGVQYLTWMVLGLRSTGNFRGSAGESKARTGAVLAWEKCWGSSKLPCENVRSLSGTVRYSSTKASHRTNKSRTQLPRMRQITFCHQCDPRALEPLLNHGQQPIQERWQPATIAGDDNPPS